MNAHPSLIRRLAYSWAGVLGAAWIAWGALPKNVTYVDAFEGKASFTRPVYFAEYPNKKGYFVVLQQNGYAFVLHKESDAWVKDTLAKISVEQNDEMGLLGFAFHPKFSENRKYYLSYIPSGSGFSTISERVTDASFIKDSGTPPKTILEVKQPDWNHNGGSIAFNPKDGFMYLGFGDGGGSGDPKKNGQNKNTLLGKMLRINVDKAENGKNYAIPSDNPFVGVADAMPEIWAYGLRNPWKWSFDPLDPDQLWVGDVGQNVWEEIDLVKKGDNMGWSIMEGFHCFDPSNPNSTHDNCDKSGMVLPVVELKHSPNNCVIGGYVFRANPNSPYYGAYFFGDYNSDSMWVMTAKDGKVTERVGLPSLSQRPTSFGVDLSGQIYVLGLEGKVFRLESPDLKPSTVKLEKLRQEKGLRKSLRKTLQGWQVNDGFGHGTLALEIFDMQGNKVHAFATSDLEARKTFSVTPGLYIAKALRGNTWISQQMNLH